jgi:hypothetical protein
LNELMNRVVQAPERDPFGFGLDEGIAAHGDATQAIPMLNQAPRLK